MIHVVPVLSLKGLFGIFFDLIVLYFLGEYIALLAYPLNIDEEFLFKAIHLALSMWNIHL